MILKKKDNSNMRRINLKGMGVALITPFRSDKSVDYDALSRLLEYQIKNGVDYIVVLATTAETATLSEEEKRSVRNFVVERVNGRVPLTCRTHENAIISATFSALPFYHETV